MTRRLGWLSRPYALCVLMCFVHIRVFACLPCLLAFLTCVFAYVLAFSCFLFLLAFLLALLPFFAFLARLLCSFACFARLLALLVCLLCLLAFFARLLALLACFARSLALLACLLALLACLRLQLWWEARTIPLCRSRRAPALSYRPMASSSPTPTSSTRLEKGDFSPCSSAGRNSRYSPWRFFLAGGGRGRGIADPLSTNDVCLALAGKTDCRRLFAFTGHRRHSVLLPRFRVAYF